MSTLPARLSWKAFNRQEFNQLSQFCIQKAEHHLRGGRLALAGDYATRAMHLNPTTEAYRYVSVVGHLLQIPDLYNSADIQLAENGEPLYDFTKLQDYVFRDGTEEIIVRAPNIPEAAPSYLVKVQDVPKLGRALVATAPIAKGNTIFAESPWLCVPAAKRPVCAHCLKSPLPFKSPKCILPKGGEIVRGTCTDAYCTEACRNAAKEEYHEKQCSSSSYASFVNSCETSLGPEVSLACKAVGKICTIANTAHPMELPPLRVLNGYVRYDSWTMFDLNFSMELALALKQPLVFLEDVMTIYAVVQYNEITTVDGLRLYQYVPMTMHTTDST
eukprot:PhF_6_TR29330/c0_g1_i1/m.43046